MTTQLTEVGYLLICAAAAKNRGDHDLHTRLLDKIKALRPDWAEEETT